MPALTIVRLIKSCIATSSSISTHIFSSSMFSTLTSEISSCSEQILGIKIEKTEPLPFSEETPTSPPIS